MGTYTDLSIANYPVITTKGGVNPVVMTIFRESDKRIFKRQRSDYNEVPWETPDNEEEIEIACIYCNTAQNIKQRLDVIGFSLQKTQADFSAEVAEKIKGLEEIKERLGEDLSELSNGESLIEKSSFDDWMNAFRFILTNNLQIEYWEKLPETYPPLVRLMLSGEDGDYGSLYHFPCTDLLYLLRAFLEVSEPESLVVQDISELVHAGYYDIEDEVCKSSIETLTADYPHNSKIVILTEGSSDKAALEISLKLLYPHLYDYYSFMDFGVSNSAGGANFLVSAVKAFVGSGITNRIVAVFDNDTAASVAQKGLSKTLMPDNIKVIAYPDIDLARNYPAIGPAGISQMNINGLACSIELYFGADVLIQDGKLTPVQWKGYDESINQYQGEILNKKTIQDAFMKKARRCIADRNALNTTDWESMRIVWKCIFQCFS